MRYMLDTHICIYLIRCHPREVVAKLADCVEDDVVVIKRKNDEKHVGHHTGRAAVWCRTSCGRPHKFRKTK